MKDDEKNGLKVIIHAGVLTDVGREISDAIRHSEESWKAAQHFTAAALAATVAAGLPVTRLDEYKAALAIANFLKWIGGKDGRTKDTSDYSR